jgi:ethanolamine utilization protein EutN
MYIGKVIGNVVSTKKNSSLLGCKFLKIELSSNEEIVAIDNIGAGMGDMVLITTGHNAAYGFEQKGNLPIDAIIIGIID